MKVQQCVTVKRSPFTGRREREEGEIKLIERQTVVWLMDCKDYLLLVPTISLPMRSFFEFTKWHINISNTSFVESQSHFFPYPWSWSACSHACLEQHITAVKLQAAKANREENINQKFIDLFFNVPLHALVLWLSQCNNFPSLGETDEIAVGLSLFLFYRPFFYFSASSSWKSRNGPLIDHRIL